MIDLSYLTDEEQGKIKAVLKRDTKLKNFEEQRIKKLHKSEKDINRLKYLTGEWFYETKYNRHRDKIHGSDIIRASMGLRKPVTILELTQSWNENTSFVNREKKDVFIPPELVGLIEEPSSQSRNDRVNDHRSTEAQHERQRPEIKPRQNPFNSVNSQRDADRRINGVNEAEKTPTEDHHELCDEPQSTQVSNSQPNAEPTGKAIEIINECQTHKFTEEEGSSISKVLEWLRGSRDGTLTIPAQGEKNQEDPKVHSTSDTKSGDLENSEQQKTKPLPKSRRGLFALFSRVEKKDKICEALVSDEEAKSREYFTGELKPEAGDCLGLQDENKKTKILQVTPKEENGNKAGPACEDGSQKEIKSEISTGRLANLKSFWERGNKGHKILSIRKGDDMQECEPSPLYGKDCNALDSNVRLLKSSDPIPNPVCTSEYSVDVESNTSDMSALSSNENGKSYDLDRIQMSKDPITKQEINLIKTDAQLVSSSPLLKHTKNTTDYKLEEDVLAEFLSREISNQQKESSTFEMFLSQQENRVLINDLKSCWEKEKSSLVPVCSPTHQESSSQCCSVELSKSRIELDNPDLKHSLDQGMLSSDNEDGLVLQEDNMEMNKEKSQNPEVEQDPQDVRGRAPYMIHNTFHLKPQSPSDKQSKPSPQSLHANISVKGQHDGQQFNDSDLTRTSSSLRQFKVPPRDSYPKKKSRNPLRTFIIDMNPTDTSLSNVKTKPGQTSEEKLSNLCHFNEKLVKANTSEAKLIPLDRKPFQSTSACSQVQPCMSNDHRKTTEEDINVRPIMPKERKLSNDDQSNVRLVRSYIPLSLQYYLGLPEQAALNERNRLQVKAGEVSKQVKQDGVSIKSSSSLSQHDSEEITFDSSGSSTPEAWSFSHTSSACDSEEENPVKAALERAKTRPISISKSLEDLASSACISAVTPNTKASFSDPEQMKMMSMSVPAFNHQEMDYRKSDCASVSSYGFDRLRTYTASSSICSEVASMSSVCSSAMSIYSTVEVKGTIQFAIHYLQKLREFHIFVVQCKHLAMADPKRNRSDPYVKCYLLPDKAKYGKRKTCVRKKTLDPTYNEILRFKIPMETLRTQKLNLSVWHNDKFGHNSFLGEVEIDLSEWDFNNTQTNEYLLKGRVPSSPKHSACSQETRAKMRVALRFQSQTSDSHKHKGNGEVQIWVKECKNLPISRGVSIDPFVKCTLLPDSSRKKRQKTRVLKKTSNPEFDHIMVYEGFKAEDLKEACTELTVWDHDRLHNHFIGGIRLGPGTGKSYGADVDWMDSNSAEASLWERMMQSHNEWVEAVLPLRMLVMAKVSR